MAKSENQKVKTLYVAKYFLENSDENHPVTAGDVVDYLKAECGAPRYLPGYCCPAGCVWDGYRRRAGREIPAAVPSV